jgi:hypothetical protein
MIIKYKLNVIMYIKINNINLTSRFNDCIF